MEGTSNGDDSTNSRVPEADSGAVDGALSVGRPGAAVERSDRTDGAEPDTLVTSDEDGDSRSEAEGIADREVIREVTREVTHEALEMLVSSGPIPDAEGLYKYTPEHQERILRMAEAPRTDESSRRTRITKAQVSVIKRAQWIQATIFVGCIAATAISLWVFREPLGVIFLGPPVIQGIGAIVQSVVGKSD